MTPTDSTPLDLARRELEKAPGLTAQEILERIGSLFPGLTMASLHMWLADAVRNGELRQERTPISVMYFPPQAGINDVVLAVVPVERGGATIHQITAMVRGVLPEARITEVAHALLALRAEGKVRGPAGERLCWARRI